MKIEVNIDKKYFFVLLGAVAILAGAFFVYAYNPSGTGGNPAVFGHSVDEIDWSQIINTPRLQIAGGGIFEGNHLYLKNNNAPAGSKTWGLVVSGSDGRFNIGKAADNPPDGGVVNTVFYIEPNAPANSLRIRNNDGYVQAKGFCIEGYNCIAGQNWPSGSSGGSGENSFTDTVQLNSGWSSYIDAGFQAKAVGVTFDNGGSGSGFIPILSDGTTYTIQVDQGEVWIQRNGNNLRFQKTFGGTAILTYVAIR